MKQLSAFESFLKKPGLKELFTTFAQNKALLMELTSPIFSSFFTSKWEASQVSFLTINVFLITPTGLACGATGEVLPFHLHFLSHKSKCFYFMYIQKWLPSHVRTKALFFVGSAKIIPNSRYSRFLSKTDVDFVLADWTLFKQNTLNNTFILRLIYAFTQFCLCQKRKKKNFIHKIKFCPHWKGSLVQVWWQDQVTRTQCQARHCIHVNSTSYVIVL